MPDGCADVVWDGTSVVLVGARPGAGRFPVSSSSRNVGLRLLPGVAGAVAGVGASSLTAGPVPLADLWGARAARRLESALAGAADQHRLLERALASRLDGTDGPDPVVVEAAQLLARPGVAVDRVAAAVGLSPRELRRRFHDHVGYAPKVLQRVLRFRRFLDRAPALAVAAGGASLASAAAEAGYADQSHLGRDCRQLSGSSPAELASSVGRWAVAAGSAGSGRNVPDPG